MTGTKIRLAPGVAPALTLPLAGRRRHTLRQAADGKDST